VQGAVSEPATSAELQPEPAAEDAEEPPVASAAEAPPVMGIDRAAGAEAPADAAGPAS
jgi:hypothetical protein